MPGSLDDNPPKLFGPDEHREEYEYLLLGKGLPGKARIYVSKSLTMTYREIADEMRRVADWMDGQ